jgi:broad specificity phosphatase PhoE
MKHFFRFVVFSLAILFAVCCESGAGETQAPVLTTNTAAVSTNAQGDTTILIIRHAEKGFYGSELSAEGKVRAGKLADYFTHCTVDDKAVKLDHLFATEDSDNSKRPRLTLEPLSKATGLSINDKYKNRQYEKLAAHIKKKCQGGQVLICWHHGTIPELLTALGASPETVLPAGKWPDKEYNWVVQLRFDKDGRLTYSQCVNQSFD